MTASLVVTNVSKTIGSRSILRGIELQVAPGEVVGLLGPNGAGKTSLLKVVTAQSALTSGTVEVFGHPLTNSGSLPSGVGVMVEQPSFLEHLTGTKHLEAMSRIGGLKTDPAELLRKVGLDPDNRRKVRRYSLGMRQRLAVAQMLLSRPRLVVLDEPTNGLDALGIIEFRTLIGELAAEGAAVLMASHLLGEVERSCTRIVLLNHGEAVGGVDLSRFDQQRIRIGLAEETDWRTFVSITPMKGLIRQGTFGTFTSSTAIDSIIAQAVAAGVRVVHASLEPVDLEGVLIDLARQP